MHCASSPTTQLESSKKAKEATVNALGSAGDSQLINQSRSVLSHMWEVTLNCCCPHTYSFSAVHGKYAIRT